MKESNTKRPAKTRAPLVLFAILAIHILLTTHMACENSPNLDEPAHLMSGLSHWKLANFDLYHVNPPLIRMLGSMPMLSVTPKADWNLVSTNSTPFERPEFSAGRYFFAANGERAFTDLMWARWALLPVSLMGALVSYRWANELYGHNSGLLASGMWCFCPNMQTWAVSITPDFGATAFGVLAAWRFWKWLKVSRWQNCVLAGVTLGLAALTKTTWVILFCVWPVLWLGIHVVQARISRKSSVGISVPPGHQLAVILLLGVYILNLCYGFESTGKRLGKFMFISETFGGPNAHQQGGNRFAGTWLGQIPVPVPANFLLGIDVQKYDFEAKKWSYLRGEQKSGGWWYYYLYAIIVKTPIGFLVLIALSPILLFFGVGSSWLNETVLITPAVVVLVLVSSQTGFNRHLRYALPAVPFLYIWTSRVLMNAKPMLTVRKLTTVMMFGWGTASCLSVFPFSHSYFNEAAGGPLGGRYHLLDSNIDWGQDVQRFRQWTVDHPSARPLYTELFTSLDLKSLGIDAEHLVTKLQIHSDQLGPVKIPPGWYAIGVNELMGYSQTGSKARLANWFQERHVVARIGYSITIFHIDN